MSKVKSPTEKKALSLKKDRRNAYGESPHGARRSIPKNKKKAHQAERRAVAQELQGLGSASNADSATELEGRAKTAARLKKLGGFAKMPDAPLGVMIERKKQRRSQKAR